LMGVVLLALLIWKLVWQPADISWPVIAVIVAYSLKSLDLQPVYDAWQRMARHAAYNMVQRGLYFALIWGILLVSPPRLTLAWIGFGLLVTAVFYLFMQQQWAQRRIKWSWNNVNWRSSIRDLYKNNFWIWLAAVGVLSFGTLNQIILKHYCGAAELGRYAASWQIMGIAVLLLGQVSRVGNPAAANVTRPESNVHGHKSFLLKYSCVMAATALPFVIPFVLFPAWIMNTIFNPEYVSSAGILRLLGVYLMVFSLGCVASQYLLSVRMEGTYFIIVVIGGLLSIILCLLLIPKYAGFGAATSLLIAHGSTMSLYWIVLIRHFRRYNQLDSTAH
jgi:polysaccharide transporter, PST family